MAKVLFKRRTTAEIEDLAVEDGALIYNTDNGKTYMDFEDERIQTGGNADTIISTETTEPTDEDIKLWINPDKVTPTGASNVVDSMDGTQTDKSLSVNAVKNYVRETSTGFLLWTNPSPNSTMSANTEINLSSSDYDMLEVIFKRTNTQTSWYSTGKVPKGIDIPLDCTSTSSDTYAWVRSRSLQYQNDTKFKSIAPAIQFVNNNAHTVENGACIPVYIIGYKTGLFN